MMLSCELRTFLQNAKRASVLLFLIVDAFRAFLFLLLFLFFIISIYVTIPLELYLLTCFIRAFKVYIALQNKVFAIQIIVSMCFWWIGNSASFLNSWQVKVSTGKRKTWNKYKSCTSRVDHCSYVNFGIWLGKYQTQNQATAKFCTEQGRIFELNKSGGGKSNLKPDSVRADFQQSWMGNQIFEKVKLFGSIH